MTVAELLAVLVEFDQAFATVFGVAIAGYLTTTVIGWFASAVRGSE